jgi:hypothetical protein
LGQRPLPVTGPRGGLFHAPVTTLEAMPSAHRNALKKILAATEQQIAEARLLKATSDEERTKLVDILADLHVRQKEMIDALTGDGESK